MSDDVQRLKEEVYGNGRYGLVRRVGRIERDLYADTATGAPGLIADVNAWRADDRERWEGLERRWAELEGAGRLLRWVAGIVSTAAGAVLLDVIRGWVGG